VITTTVTYFDAAGTALACAVPVGSTPTQALVRAVATGQTISGTRSARRVVEALVRLTQPVYGQQLTKAIFSDANLTSANNATISGSGAGSDADVYTNGSFSCSNNQSIAGSVVSQSTLSMSNSCTIAGDAWAVSGYSAANPGNSVGGRTLVSGGNATLANNATVAGGVMASGTISWNRCPAQCSAGAAVPAPPVEAFPRLSWDAATQQAWNTAGFTTVVTQNSCTAVGGLNGPGQWLWDNAATLTGPTILRTSCPLVLSPGGGGPMRLAADVAVFADGGVFLDGNLDITSTTSASRNLYLVQPYNAVPLPCTSDGIQLANHVTVDAAISMLLYSPCVVRKANLSTFTGQIYAGANVALDNQLNMTFQALPVYGVTDGSGAGQLWKADLLNKRENQ
jgi:hypothetical protein